MTENSNGPHAARLQQAMRAIQVLEDRLRAKDAEAHAPIAVTGIGCRFPGGIAGADDFWRVLRDGVDVVGEIPASRWDIDRFHDPRPLAPGKIVTRDGAVLSEVDRFDPAYFGISPREAAAMDPQQRLMLEVAKEAFDDAGRSEVRLAGSNTGVFIGVTESEYAWLQYAHLPAVDSYTATGAYGGIVANRISYLFDLKGPSFTVDSICSSSLLAVHQACESLRRRECDTALAGGVCVLTGPDQMIWLSKLGVLSANGRCRAFDAAGDGIVLGEGAGAVVLKRLDDALAEGDRVLAVIRGTAAGQDGRSNGMTAPSRSGQEAVIRRAYASSGVAPASVGYVDGHGTGTPLGDPIEANALGAVVGRGREAANPCWLGSVKTNLGHLGPVGGIASLIKVVLGLERGTIPASLHFDTPNPEIAFDDLHLQVPRAATDWPLDGAGRAFGAATSLAFGGTNVHVVMEAGRTAPEVLARPAPESGTAPRLDHLVLPLSARSSEGLSDLARRWAAWLDGLEDLSVFLDMAATQALHRDHHPWRAGLVAKDLDGMRQALADLAEGRDSLAVFRSAGPVEECEAPVFMCSGHGAQHAGMALDLMAASPVFRAAIEDFDAAARPLVGWSLVEELRNAGSGGALLQRTDMVQPAISAIQMALAALWRALGIAPAAVLGSSMGEAAAAQIAGALSVADAARVICLRSRIIAEKLHGKGAMALAELSLDEANALLAGLEDRVSVAVAQGPRTTVLSGDPEAIATICESLTARDVFNRKIAVEFASHSPYVEEVRGELAAALTGIEPKSGAVPFWSTVRAARVDGVALDASYWVDNLRRPVLFRPVIDDLAAAGHTVYLELSPHPSLLNPLEDCLADAGVRGLRLPSQNRDAPGARTFLESVVRLYAAGAEVDWTGLFAPVEPVSLPAYPWHRQRYWLDEGAGPRGLITGEAMAASGSASEPAWSRLLAAGVPLTDTPDGWAAAVSLDAAAHPWLEAHRVFGQAVLPAAALLALLAGRPDGEDAGVTVLRDVAFREALPVDADTTAVVSRRGGHATVSFRDAPDAGWSLAAEAGVAREPVRPAALHAPATIAARLPDELSGAEFYDALDPDIAGYGGPFRAIEWLRHGAGEVLARIAPVAAEAGLDGPLPATVLDACLQPAFLLTGAPPVPLIPLGVEAVRLFGPLPAGDRVLSHLRLTGEADGVLTVALTVMSEEGRPLVAIEGLRMRQARRVGQAGLWGLRWSPVEIPAAESVPGRRWAVLADGRGFARSFAEARAAAGETCLLLAADGPFVAPDALAGVGEARVDPASAGDWARVLDWVTGGDSPGGIVHASSLDLPDTLDAASASDAFSATLEPALFALKAIAAAPDAAVRLCVVTAGVAGPGDDRGAPARAMLPGFVRAAALEIGGLDWRILDFDRPDDPAAVAAVAGDGPAGQLALRDGTLFAGRVAPLDGADGPAPVPADDRNFALRLDRPGLPDAVRAVVEDDRVPGPGEVAIEVAAAGLNFMDVARALGLVAFDREVRDGLRFGMECAGRIVAVGEGVDPARIGEAVAAVTPAPCAMARRVVTHGALARPCRDLDPAEAAALPVAYMTAWHALVTRAGLKSGERVLIHSGTGGVGLAAIAIARAIGAEVFATAGSEDKRARLRAMGLEQVHDSRSLAFADEIRAATGGRGVDVVLSALAGEVARASLELLSPFGRFAEIGKRDQQAGAAMSASLLSRNVAYHAVDMAAVFADHPELSGDLLAMTLDRVASGDWPRLPVERVGIAHAADAFATMARARHIGKLVVTLDEPAAVPVIAHPRLPARGTVLITGGTGGLGLAFAEHAAGQGATAIALMARREPDAEAQVRIDALAARGVQVKTVLADVCDRAAVGCAVAEAEAALGPVAALIHGAGAIDDGVLTAMDPQRLAHALAPKVEGTLNLLDALAGRDLSLVVFHSSTAALLGARGQSNYAAANAFLDAAAQHLRAAGVPALSVQWGPWAEVGGVARMDLGDRFAERGMRPMTPEAALAGFEAALRSGQPVAGVVDLDPARWADAHPGAGEALLTDDLLAGAAGTARDSAGGGILARLRGIDGAARHAAMVEHLRETVGRVIGTAPASIDTTTQTLGTLGLDSLMSLELRNRLEADLGLRLSATLAWNHPAFPDLAAHLLSLVGLGGADEAPAPAVAAEPVGMPEELGEERIAAMSDEEAEAELRRRLAEIGDD